MLSSPNEVQADGVSPIVAKVMAVAESMFACRPEVEVAHDPEDPDHTFVVITVHAAGELSSLIAKRLEWHERIERIAPQSAGLFRLSIIPQ